MNHLQAIRVQSKWRIDAVFPIWLLCPLGYCEGGLKLQSNAINVSLESVILRYHVGPNV